MNSQSQVSWVCKVTFPDQARHSCETKQQSSIERDMDVEAGISDVIVRHWVLNFMRDSR